ncbi:hypothetical protein P0Y43_02985 [Pseudomonas entomophila]|uniref:hypothetical protein n=1 Tax=Pseudomonas entomophila TaxID=312306 RepID=UPI0023D8B059|nr:hypothetical protein [Pseudomonas entomophila]MDF0729694.1 hypothetical protein [Pseudomonas entomophila]
MSKEQKTLLIVSNDKQIAKLIDTFTIEKIYITPLKDFTFEYIYVAATHYDARLLKTGYLGKIRSTTVSRKDDKWAHKFVVADILSVSTIDGLPRSIQETENGDVFEADLSVHLSPPDLEGSTHSDLKINNHDDDRLLTIVDAINRISATYDIPRSNIKISISGHCDQ